MLSLYIHIPFCIHKCAYCSFFVLPETDISQEKQGRIEEMKALYLQQVLQENASWREKLGEQQIKTIYIWWWTPFQLWKERLFLLIDSLLETWDTAFLEELSIELNPDPMDEVLDFIREAGKKYKKLFKLRFSIGIQTFDDKILEASWRNYYFNNLIWFFRELQQIKQANMHYNFDFIAFGSRRENRTQEVRREKQTNTKKIEIWNKIKREFFEKLAESHVADGYSIYTLELFPGSQRYNQQSNLSLWTWKDAQTKKIHPLQGDDDAIYDEFLFLRDIVYRAGYHRYEISNFALRGKRSLHNMVYRNMESYLWLGINSSSYLSSTLGNKLSSFADIFENADDIVWYRFTNTTHRKSYLAGEWLDQASLSPLHEKEYKIEKAFLALRTDRWLQQVREQWSDLFVPHREDLLDEWHQQWIVSRDKHADSLKLTDKWWDLYNSVITDLFLTL